MITHTRIEREIARAAPFDILVNDEPVRCHPGEMLATAILAAGITSFRRTEAGAPRMPVCNMGVCFDCFVHVAGIGMVRACMTPSQPGMAVELPKARP